MPGKRKRPGDRSTDASYKSFFASRRTVADTLRSVFRDLALGLDFSTLERLPASFVTEHLGQRHADMLWRIRTADETWLYLLGPARVSVHHRPSHGPANVGLHGPSASGSRQERPGPRRRVPTLPAHRRLQRERRWNAATDIRELFAPVPRTCFGYLPRHRYLLLSCRRSMHRCCRPGTCCR